MSFRLLTACVALLATSALPLPGAERPPAERYAEVCSFFEKGDYTRAQYIAEGLLKDGHLSPQLFQMLGHIHYRRGDLGRAALSYQRASLFPPPVPEVRQNIAHIHDRTGNLAFPANGFRDQFAARLTRSQWGGIVVTSGWVLLYAVVLCLLFSRTPSLRAPLVLVAVLASVVGVIAGLGWFWHPSFEKVERLAYVTTSETKAFTAATVTSGSVSALPPGSSVRILEDRDLWSYVEIPAEGEYRRGWVQTAALTRFWPYDPGYLE